MGSDIVRTFDGELIDEATIEYQYDFDPHEWVADRRNIAILTGDDLNLFQYQSEGAYIGHFFYKSRGKAALETARKALNFIFKQKGVEVLIGLTPIDKLGARWISRKLGFKSYGEIETVPGPCELFILTKTEYEQLLAAKKKDEA